MHLAGLDGQGGTAHGGPGQAGDHALPFHHLFLAEQRGTEEFLEVLERDLDRRLVVFQKLDGGLAHDPVQLFLQLPDTGLPGVALDHLAQGCGGQIDTLFGDIVALEQLGPEVVSGDGLLLFGDIARQANLLHTVEQRRRDGIQGIGGAHEQHLGQIQTNVQVVVEEVDVLLRVQHLEQGRGRIALEGLAHLVDLVEHDHRVLDLDLLERLDQLAGHGADVGAPVALDLGLVAHATHREAIELTAERLGDGATDGGLADTWWSHQQHDGAPHVTLEGALGEELDDPLLDVGESVMVAVEYLSGVGQVQLVLAALAPGHGRQPVQIVAGGAIFGRTGLEHRQLGQLVVDAFLHPLGHLAALEARAEGVDVVFTVVLGDAQLTLDHLELLAQEEFALTLLHLGVDLLADLALQLRHLDLLAQQRQHLLHPRHHRQRGEHVLQLLPLGGGDGGGEVGQRARLVGTEAIEVVLEFLAVQRIDRQQFLDAVDQRHGVGAGLVFLRVHRLARVGHLDQKRRGARQPALDLEASHALGDELDLVVLALQLVGLDRGADGRKVLVGQLLDTGLSDEGETDGVMGRIGDPLDGLGPAFAVDHQRLHLGGKEGTIVNRQQVKPFRQRGAGRNHRMALDLLAIGQAVRGSVFGVATHGNPVQIVGPGIAIIAHGVLILK